MKYIKHYKDIIQLNFEVNNNEKYKIKDIWDNMIFAKESKANHPLVRNLLFWYNNKEHLRACIGGWIFWKLLALWHDFFFVFLIILTLNSLNYNSLDFQIVWLLTAWPYSSKQKRGQLPTNNSSKKTNKKYKLQGSSSRLVFFFSSYWVESFFIDLFIGFSFFLYYLF